MIPQQGSSRWNPSRCGLLFAVSLFSIFLFPGCSLFQKQQLQELNYISQKEMVLGIVPLQTSRDETVKKLADAGIAGDFSELSRTVYYCQFKADRRGRKQPLSIALLFDKDGKFYATQQAELNIETR